MVTVHNLQSRLRLSGAIPLDNFSSYTIRLEQLPVSQNLHSHVIICLGWQSSSHDLWVYSTVSRSQWPRGLRHGPAAARLLKLRVRILPGAWMFLFLASVVCCHVEVSARGLSLVQMSPTKWGVSDCDRDASLMRPCPNRGCWAMGKRN